MKKKKKSDEARAKEEEFRGKKERKIEYSIEINKRRKCDT